MNITQADITTTGYLFILTGTVIAFVGSIVVYLNKKSKKKRSKK
jgi:hypothetical protein